MKGFANNADLGADKENSKLAPATLVSNDEDKTYTFPSGAAAQYVRLTPLASVGNFFSARELAVYKKDGTKMWEVGSNKQDPSVSEKNLSVAMTNFADGKQSVNVAFANRGDKALFNGSEAVATFKLKAKRETDVKLPYISMLVGPKLDVVELATDENGKLPEQPGGSRVELTQDDFNIKITNKGLPKDEDGSTQKFEGGEFDKTQGVYTFAPSKENAAKKVARVDIKPLETPDVHIAHDFRNQLQLRRRRREAREAPGGQDRASGKVR